jgi:hypothetical protein
MLSINVTERRIIQHEDRDCKTEALGEKLVPLHISLKII